MPKEQFWIRTSDLDYEIPTKHKAGSLLLFPSTRVAAKQAGVAIRVDVIDEDGDIEPCLLWLTENESSNAKPANVDRCRDFHLNEERVLGLSNLKAELSVELDGIAKSQPGHRIAWDKGRGCFATGSFGYRIVGMAEDVRRNQFPTPIDPVTWIADLKLVSSRVQPKLWYPAWRVCVHRRGGELMRAFEMGAMADL